jgi:branched-chain amino acid transport system permease protein
MGDAGARQGGARHEGAQHEAARREAARPEAAAIAQRRREIAAGVASLVTPQLIEEHRSSPAGRHSPALALVLAYFRQEPVRAKLALLATDPGRRWQVVELSGEQGRPHEPVTEAGFDSEDEAGEEVFLRRLAAIGALPARSAAVAEGGAGEVAAADGAARAGAGGDGGAAQGVAGDG